MIHLVVQLVLLLLAFLAARQLVQQPSTPNLVQEQLQNLVLLSLVQKIQQRLLLVELLTTQTITTPQLRLLVLEQLEFLVDLFQRLLSTSIPALPLIQQQLLVHLVLLLQFSLALKVELPLRLPSTCITLTLLLLLELRALLSLVSQLTELALVLLVYLQANWLPQLLIRRVIPTLSLALLEHQLTN